MPFSQYLAQQTLNWFRSSQLDLPPTNLFISLHSADPGRNGTTSDITVAVAGGRGTLPTANLSAPVLSALPGGGFQISNTAPVLMTSNAPGSGTLTFFGVWTAITGGNFLAYGTLTTPITAQVGDVLQFATGQLVIRGL
jgi:hypothetical protein